NEALHIKDIELPDGVTAVGDPDEIIATVSAKRGVAAAEAELAEGEDEAPTEPEVIGRKAKDEEGESEE
ncbi:MAG: 50S ribosomal protein L25, partial [Planctomycetota bacterium]